MAMAKRGKRPGDGELRLRLRLLYGQEIALGPGKVELLRLVDETGSIRQAAARMGMSYMRAWTLIRTMNRCFEEPLVGAVRGGPEHGGAKITPTGRKVLELYLRLERECLAATKGARRSLTAMLKRR